jgi:site-specific recombinase XerD
LDGKQQNELDRKIRKFGNIRELAIVRLMLAGLRVQELVDLCRNDIEISERKGVVTVRDGKHGKFRKVALNKDFRQVLSAYMGEYGGHGDATLFTLSWQ